MAALSVKGLRVELGRQAIFDGFDLEVRDGEFLVLVGPSGSGKSTLLRAIAGLVPLGAGSIHIGERRAEALDPRERDVAMVFQNYALYPHKNVRGNLAFPLELRQLSRATVEERVRQTAELLGLSSLLERKPAQLSGGQMQRVALGRALIREPKLFLFDEPLSNLDAQLRAEMRSELARLHARLRITSLYVTHDQVEAMTLGARVAVLERGRLEQLAAPLELFERPSTSFVAGFIGSPAMNLVEGRVLAARFERGAFSVWAPLPNGPVLLGVRPHRLAIGPAAGDRPRWQLCARGVERLGTQTILSCDWDGQELRACCEGDLAIGPGEPVELSCSSLDLHWFDAHSGQRLG